MLCTSRLQLRAGCLGFPVVIDSVYLAFVPIRLQERKMQFCSVVRQRWCSVGTCPCRDSLGDCNEDRILQKHK